MATSWTEKGTFTKTFKNNVSCGTTAVGVAVPTADNSGGLRATRMELYIRPAATSACPVVWAYDTNPVGSGEGVFLPAQSLQSYPVSPSVKTLMVAATGISLTSGSVFTYGLMVNWYLQGIHD